MATNTEHDRQSFQLGYDEDILTVSESYNLTTDSLTEYPDLSTLPLIGSYHPTYSNARCRSVNIVPGQLLKGNYFKAVVTYTTNPGGSLNPNLNTQWSFSTGIVSQAIDRDKNGNPITNSSGEPPTSEVPKSFRVVSFTGRKYFNSLDLVSWNAVVTKLNSTTFYASPTIPPSTGALFSFPEKTVQCIGLDVAEFDVDSPLYLAAFKFIYDENKHILEFLDQGYSYYDDDTARSIYSYENTDKQPRLLNGSGKLFGQTFGAGINYPYTNPPGSTVKNRPDMSPTGTFLQWDIYNTTDMNAIGL